MQSTYWSNDSGLALVHLIPVLQNLIMHSSCIIDDVTQVLTEQWAGKLVALLSPGWMATILNPEWS